MHEDGQKATGTAEQAPPQIPAEVVRVLLEDRQRFLAFVQRQVGSRDVAEDILQEALARGIDRLGSLRDEELIVAWFYQVLRNAVFDHYRRRDTATRGLEAFSQEVERAHEPGQDRQEGVCKCVSRLATALKPEYAEALQRIEVEGLPVKAFAEERGLSNGNAGVRVFRAREALRRAVKASCGHCATDGCQNCTCGEAPGAASES